MKVKLSDAFELQMGKTPDRSDSSCWSGVHKWVSIADLSKADKYIIDTKETISDTGVAKSGIKVVPKGTVIMSFKLSIGKTAITTEDLYTNEAIMAFIDKGIYEIDTNYIYHLFASKDWNEGTNKAVLGLTLNKATLSQVEIEIPSIAEQKQVVEVLDKVDELISLRRKQLQKLDDLIKSRFVEMFGKEKHMMAMSEICAIITDGTHQPPKFVSEGIPFIFVSNITENRITYEAEKFIDDNTYNDLIKRTPIEIGDVLLSTVGSYGHPAVVRSEKKFLFQRHIAYLKPRKELIDSDYLHVAILSPDAQFQIEQGVKGIAQKTLNLSEIKKIRIPVPELRKQKEFSYYIKHLDKSKLTIRLGLEKLEQMKQALVQKYFG